MRLEYDADMSRAFEATQDTEKASVRTMARRLGRDDSSFVRPIARLEASLESDPTLRQRVDRIIHHLAGATPPPKSANQD